MADYSLVVIGGGLSGLAAAIRHARFDNSVLVLEKHNKAGGLNSYYHRRGFLLETGLHAMTNYAPADARHAPLNLLLRQLKISRKKLDFHEQKGSLIHFPNQTLFFTNELEILLGEIAEKFPQEIDKVRRLISEIEQYPDPAAEVKDKSARRFLEAYLDDPLLIDMLLLPLMMYGNSSEYDMDLGLFIILFRSILIEGLFRPAGTIKDFLDLLIDHYLSLGGEIKFNSEVEEVLASGNKITGVKLANKEKIFCENLISTAGVTATSRLLPGVVKTEIPTGRMSFFESIYVLPREKNKLHEKGKTNIFYNLNERLSFKRPDQAIDSSWGVICFPGNFQDLSDGDNFQIRITNSASYQIWRDLSPEDYSDMKMRWAEESRKAIAPLIGEFYKDVILEDTFTPLTVEKYTAKDGGAVYGSPVKIKDGKTEYDNLYIAGTDQGLLGIVGSMLSGVTMVNKHILM